MPKYPFLSDEWVEEARRIYAQAEASGPVVQGASLAPARVNLIVTDAPFSSSSVQAHVDSSVGTLQIGTGHLDKPDVTVSMSYETARSLFVAGDVQTVMQAFLGGRIRVDGDLSKLLDPRSGIWPSSLGVASSLTGSPSPAAPAAPSAPGAPPAAGAPPALVGPSDVAAQLQEITE